MPLDRSGTSHAVVQVRKKISDDGQKIPHPFENELFGNVYIRNVLDNVSENVSKHVLPDVSETFLRRKMTPPHGVRNFWENVTENFVFEWVVFFSMILNHSEKFLTRFRYVSWIYMLRGGFVDTDPKCFRLALRVRPFWWCPDPSTVPPRLLNPLGWVWNHVRVVLKWFAWPPNGSSRRPVAHILSGNKVMRTQEPDGKRRRGRPRTRPRKCEFTSPRFSARSWALNISECSVSATGLRHGVKTVPPPVHATQQPNHHMIC